MLPTGQRHTSSPLERQYVFNHIHIIDWGVYVIFAVRKIDINPLRNIKKRTYHLYEKDDYASIIFPYRSKLWGRKKIKTIQ